MNYEQAMAYWLGHVNYELRTPTATDFHLDRMRGLLSLLGDPHRRLRIVHVAGSKGKGSTSAMLAAILQRAGYRVGLFTSPHLSRVEERFQVNGQPITSSELAALLTEVRDALSRKTSTSSPPLTPTFFDIATAVGFLHFVRRRVELAVIEVGLGGRLDSTNVCQPLLAIITSISLDHTLQLGDRLASIAREKAGIIKPRLPVISGATVPEARAVIEDVACLRNAPLIQLGVDFHYRYQPGQVTAEGLKRPCVEVTTRTRQWPILEPNLLGEHQAANTAVAVASVEQLRVQGLHISDRAVAAGLREVAWPARLEVVGRSPLVVLDCAHNVASALALVETLQASFPPARRLLVFASSGDKDIAGIFRVLAPHFAQAFLTRYANSPRAATAEHLAELLQAAGGLPATLSPTPAAAYQAARAAAGPDDLICITGSVFLAGELRPVIITQ
jgi:dihydrofolate synthase/folylpolyglutamate synthase